MSSILRKPTSEVNESDLDSLIAACVREGKEIEFKERLNIGTEDQKRKFIASITSFANASGGDLIFGIHADDGVATQITPLEGFNPDRDSLTLRDLIRAHIEPPVLGVEFHVVPARGGHAMVIRVPRSWSGAHMVTFQNDNRFYARDHNGRVLMNVPEIRAAFTASEVIARQIQRFRAERLSAIRAEEVGVDVEPGPKYVLHVLPFRAFEPGFRANLDALLCGHSFYPMRFEGGWNLTHDIEGCYAFESPKGLPSLGYSLAFRTGCVEAVQGFHRPALQQRHIPNPGFEVELCSFIRHCIEWLKLMEVDEPIAIGLSFLDVKDFTLYFSPHREPVPLHRIRHRDLVIPDSVIEKREDALDSILQPICDAIWRACGMQRSFNFDEGGQFKPQAW